MTSYELHLPVFKRGTDLRYKIDNSDSLEEAFENQAQAYEAAASLCRRLASVAVEHDLSVHADTHYIGVEGPENVLEALVEDDILTKVDHDFSEE